MWLLFNDLTLLELTREEIENKSFIAKLPQTNKATLRQPLRGVVQVSLLHITKLGLIILISQFFLEMGKKTMVL